jgi:hypothetical protein
MTIWLKTLLGCGLSVIITASQSVVTAEHNEPESMLTTPPSSVDVRPRMARIDVGESITFRAVGRTGDGPHKRLSNGVLFFEDFEGDRSQWPSHANMGLTTKSAFAGNRSQTFGAVSDGGDARSHMFSVTPGQTYYLHVAYMTLGDGGFIGATYYPASKDPLLAYTQWILGDGTPGCCNPPLLGNWDYNVTDTNPAHLGVWKQYSQAVTIPDNVHFVELSVQDWVGGLPNNPLTQGIFLDNIEFSSNPQPSHTWSSNKPAVASIGETGRAFGAGPGRAAITGTFNGLSDRSELLVVGMTGLLAFPQNRSIPVDRMIDFDAVGVFNDWSRRVRRLDRRVLFFDDFENGPGQWDTPGHMDLTTAQAYGCTHSQTFTDVAREGDARSATFAVTPGRTYYLHTAYMTQGGGGWIAVEQFGPAMEPRGLRWIIGDQGPQCCNPAEPPLAAWDYNFYDRNPAHLGVWKTYSQAYTIPENVAFIRLVIEDWEGGLPNDSHDHGVFFDNVEWSERPFPTASWCSSSPEVATIDRRGLAKAVGVGSTTITATAGGFTATSTLNVVPKRLPRRR